MTLDSHYTYSIQPPIDSSAAKSYHGNIWGMGGSPYHAKGQMGIYWELGDVQTTPEKVSAR